MVINLVMSPMSWPGTNIDPSVAVCKSLLIYLVE
jgi:hypothetical protein